MNEVTKLTGVEVRDVIAKDPGISVQEVLATDTRPVADELRESSPIFLGDGDISIDRYITKEFHDAEKRAIWRKVWQMACRENDIPEPGDHIVYEVGTDSIIVARNERGEINAFTNVCLHRGMLLRDCSGNVDEFRCPYHGFTWDLSGDLKFKPTDWDFPHVTKENFHLSPVRVGTWDGFVFICMNPDTESLESYIETLPKHFSRWPMAKRHKSVHVAKIIRSNWKAAMEAFLEGFHIPNTHPQTLNYSGDSNSQYDVWPDVRHVSRVISNMGVRSGSTPEHVTEQDMLDGLLRDMPIVGKSGEVLLREGETARNVFAERFRNVLSRSTGVDLSTATDAEIVDSIQYYLFPNFAPWSGIGSPIVYRWRPYGDDPNMCVMEVMFLFVQPDDAPKKRDCEIHWLDADTPFTAAKGLGALAPVLDQDAHNLEKLQRGLHAARKPGITLANYQEIRLRFFHQTLDAYLAAAGEKVGSAANKPA